MLYVGKSNKGGQNSLKMEKINEPSITEIKKNILRAVNQCCGQRVTTQRLAQVAGCSVETLHKHLEDPQFRTFFLETLKNSLVAEVPQIASAFVLAARDGSFKHGKLIFELTGLYTDTKHIEANIKTHEEDPFKSDEDKISFLESTLAELRERTQTEGAD